MDRCRQHRHSHWHHGLFHPSGQPDEQRDYRPRHRRALGFIRAEVIKYADYLQYGSEAAVREAGKLAVEGKDYVVQDGDIMHFRFNV